MSAVRSANKGVRLSVVVPAHQAVDLLGQQIDALLAQDDGNHWELIIVVNRSTDGTAALVEQYARQDPRVRLVRADDQPNASYARNVGAALARGRALAFLDADDVAAAGWLTAMDAALAEHELVAGPLEHCHLNPSWAVEARGAPQQDGFFFVTGGPPWPLLFGANLGVTRVRHDQVGGFDERLPWGGEDADYGWRLQLAGAVPHWAPAAVVHYRLRQELRPLYRQSVGYGRSMFDLYVRYSEHWPVPPRARSGVRLAVGAVRRLLRVRSAGGAARYLCDLGWDVGQRKGARRSLRPGDAASVGRRPGRSRWSRRYRTPAPGATPRWTGRGASG